MGLLDSLLSTGKKHKEVIGIAVTPALGLEVAVVDKTAKVVKNYGRRKIDYDISRREIMDIGQFKSALGELLNQMDILTSTSSLAYLVLPNVYFDFLELAGEPQAEEIKTAILSEAEEFFIFKREEPVSGYCEVRNLNSTERKRYVYSSFQKEQIENIKAAIEDCGLKLIGAETNYTATLRGLYTAGFADDLILGDESWSVVLINTNSFAVFKMEGRDLTGHLEVPLAIRAYSVDEAYDAIITNVSQILDDYQSSKLFVISQVDEISAEIVKRKMRSGCDMEAIESNKFAQGNQFMDVKAALDFNEANSMSLAVIGATNLSSDFGLILNVLSDDINASLGVYFTKEILGKNVDITQQFVLQAGIVSCVIFAVAFGGVCFAINMLNGGYKSTVSNIESEINKINAQIEEAQKDGDKEEVNISIEIDKVAAENVNAISFYDSIATDIPKNIWLTTYYNKNGTQIVIRGIAETIADVYEYYKNLKIVSPESDIKLSELKVFASSLSDKVKEGLEEGKIDPNQKIASGLLIDDSDRLYSFEISNTQMNMGTVSGGSETEIISRPAAKEGEEKEGESVEEISQQMKPARKRKAQNEKVN